MLKSCVHQGARQLGSPSVIDGPCGPPDGSVHDRAELVPHLPDGTFEVLEATPHRLVGVVGIEFVSEVITESTTGVPTIAKSVDGVFDRIELGGRGYSKWHARLLVVVVITITRVPELLRVVPREKPPRQLAGRLEILVCLRL